MTALSAWIGWSGSGQAPGYGWLPGPKLRFVILTLVYACLALTLTVNYAASVTFFLLAIIGMYVGFRRGFVNGLTRAEKIVMLVFAAYPAGAIFSYLAGTQTNVGFRFLGRDLRFLLFIPIYLAVRWCRPRAGHIGWALAGGAVGAFVLGLIQNEPWPAPGPHGVAGDHISFGDLGLLSGFLAAALLLHGESSVTASGKAWRMAGALLAVLFGLAVSVLSGARGGWLAVPVLLTLLFLGSSLAQKVRLRLRIVVVLASLLALLAGAWAMPSVRHRIDQARQNLSAYVVVANARTIDTLCVDRRGFLEALVRRSRIRGPGQVEVVRLPKEQNRQLARFGCKGGYALSLRNPLGNSKPLDLWLFRGHGISRSVRQSPQTATVLARGTGSFNVGWKGPWTEITESHGWQDYGATQSYDYMADVIVRVPPNAHMLLIPIQKPHGVFAYALADSSVGHRLEMWLAAWALFRAHPWLGAGTGAFRALGERALGSGATAPIVGDYDHAHSDYFTTLGTTGIVGLLVLLGVLFGPYFATLRLQRSEGEDVTVLAGAILVIGFAIFGLTETMFIHSLDISWYAVVSAVILAAAATGAGFVRRPGAVFNTNRTVTGGATASSAAGRLANVK